MGISAALARVSPQQDAASKEKGAEREGKSPKTSASLDWFGSNTVRSRREKHSDGERDSGRVCCCGLV